MHHFRLSPTLYFLAKFMLELLLDTVRPHYLRLLPTIFVATFIGIS